MAPTDKRLARDIGLTLALKLALITLLWWCFFRGSSVSVDEAQMASHIGVPPVAQTADDASTPRSAR
jgi:hypothetical protein